MDLAFFKPNQTYANFFKLFTKELKIPLKIIDDKSISIEYLFKNSPTKLKELIKEVYALGVINDEAFTAKDKTVALSEIKKNYQGIFIVAILLKKKDPTRADLALIARELNRKYPIPVIVAYQYQDQIAIASSERRPYNQKSQVGEKIGKITILKDLTPKKLHAGHSQILKELVIKDEIKTLAQLHEHWLTIFNISILNKNFYSQLYQWYLWATDEVTFPSKPTATDEQNRQQNIIHLLTRILFVWFIKEKNLIPAELFNQAKIATLISLENCSSYYKAILQNLFFATLNQEIAKRKFRNHSQNHNITNLFRYESYFKNKDEFLALTKKIPFMNGGLFECLDAPNKEEKKGRQGGILTSYIDGFSDRKDNILKVPNELFFGNPAAEKQGLFQLFNNYKFTIEENTPLTHEIALDPELLGRVFENLLATYNPETGETARKETGSFYTPREIVDYMVDESLLAYLKTKLPTKTQNLKQFLSYEETPEFTNEQKENIIQALNDCKILDPACGSGAFLMGILQKMVYLINKLDPKNKLWQEQQIAKANTIEDSEIRGKAIDDIRLAFANNELDYGRKLYLIEKCIYGVDIQPIAVQISKLRFFISLVVNQTSNSDLKKNFGIRALPNLETKLTAADSLIGIKTEDGRLVIKPEVEELKTKLKDIHRDLFSAKTPTTKNKLRAADKKIRKQFVAVLKGDWGNTAAEQLASWDPYDQNAAAVFFDPEWMFGITAGFDLVIGNPPYIQLQKDGGRLGNKYESQEYKSFARTGDIYCLFYERGNQLLKKKGHLCYITSNKWLRAGYGEKIRSYFTKHTTPVKLIDFGGYKVFETSTVDVNILLLQQQKPTTTNLLACNITKDFTAHPNLADYFANNKSTLTNLSKESWLIADQQTLQLKAKIEQIGTPLKDWDINIRRGITTGCNQAFIIDKAKRDELITKDSKNAEIIKPLLQGKDIKRYSYNFADKYLIHSHNGLKKSGINPSGIKPIDVKKNYPTIYKYLKTFSPAIKTRKSQGKHWSNVVICAYYPEFAKKKIVWPDISSIPAFNIVDESFYINNSAYTMNNTAQKYLIAVLNSSVIKFYFLLIASGLGGAVRWIKQFIDLIPIPKPTPKQEQQMIKLTEQMLMLHHQQKEQTQPAQPLTQQIALVDQKINQLVYQLYQLNDDEINLINQH